MSRAINTAINSARTEAVRELSGLYYTYTGSTELRQSIKIISASPKRLKATLVATSSALRIAKFKIHLGHPLVSEIVKGRPKEWPHGFYAKMKGPLGNPHYGLFARRKEWSIPEEGLYEGKIKTKKASRGEDRGEVGEPIQRQQLFEGYTISIAHGIGHGVVIGRILELAEQKLTPELDRQIGLFLRGEVR
jgi:hypothetical protein